MNFIIYYLLGINVITFIVFGFDKVKAKKHLYRIPEKTLFALMFFGGIVGGLLGMKYLRHKTQKKEFKQVVYFIASIQVIIVAFILYGLYRN